MTYDSNILNQIIRLRADHQLFINCRKNLYYRRLLLYLGLVVCRILTLEQFLLLNNLKINQENVLRKDLSNYCRQGHLIREPFMYCERYATYSLSKKGLEWLEQQLPISISSDKDLLLNNESIKAVYKERRKDKPSNHLVCINQVRLGIICGATVPLNLKIKQEQPCSIDGHKQNAYKKSEGQIVPDLMFQCHGIPVYFEADTTMVGFHSPRGNAEKISKYAMMSSPLDEKYACHQRHVVFSIQKKIGAIKAQTSPLSEVASHVFINPELINQSVTIIRLIAALNNGASDATLHTIEDAMKYMQKHAPYLGESLLKSPLIQHTSLLLSGLIQSGFGTEPLSNLRKVISMVCAIQKQKQDAMKQNAGLSATEKRKSELYEEIVGSKHILWNCQHGLSISCLYGPMLSFGLPFMLPMFYYPPQDITRRLFHCGIITNEYFLISSSPSLPCRMMKKCEGNTNNTTTYYDTALNNAYHFRHTNGHILTVFLENISDDIGGYLRAQKYIQLPPGFRNDTFLLMLVRDDLVTADGKSVYDGGIYYDAVSGTVPYFVDPGTGLADKSGLHVLDYFIRQRPDYALPFLYGITQDYAYLTYSEFTQANETMAEPKLYIPVKEDIIIRHGHDNTSFNPCSYSSLESVEQYATTFY